MTPRTDETPHGDLIAVMPLLVPGACPALPTGPDSPLTDERYIATHGALPPRWSPRERLAWECRRDDAVLTVARRGSSPNQVEAALRWLTRYGLDRTGRPRAWQVTDPAGAAARTVLAHTQPDNVPYATDHPLEKAGTPACPLSSPKTT